MTCADPPATLSVEGLRTWFMSPDGMVKAVDGASFEVPRGGRVGIVGESGSGKTQLLLSVFGLSRGRPGVVAGQACFEETELFGDLESYVDTAGGPGAAHLSKDVARWERDREAAFRSARERTSFIFQEPRSALIPYWTVMRHFRSFLGRGRDGWMDEAERALRALGVSRPDELLHAFPDELSGGEAQRVMLALALARRPDLVIADEPTASVDAGAQRRTLDELARVVAEADASLIIVSHDPAVINFLADHVVVMLAGRIVERLSSELLEKLPDGELHPYTAALRASWRSRSEGELAGPAPRRSREVPAERRGGGCPYSHRCDLRPRLSAAMAEECGKRMPPLATRNGRGSVACWGLEQP